MMFGRQMLLLSVFLVSTSAVAQDAVDLPLQWKAGNKLQYEIVKTRRRVQDGQITVKGTTRTDLEVQVVKVEKSGFLVGWTQGESRFDDPRQAANPVVQQMASLFKDFQILLELDNTAVLVGVRNWEELKEKSSTILTTLDKLLQDGGMDEATIEKILAPVAATCETRKGIETMCTREAQLFFMVLGGSYSASEPVEYEDRLPNPFGGEPFPSRATFLLKKVDRDSGLATIKWTQTIAPDQAKSILEKTLKDMAARFGGKVPEEELPKSVTIEDNANFIVELSSGWPKRMTHTRTVKFGEDTQEDILTIARKQEQKPGPK